VPSHTALPWRPDRSYVDKVTAIDQLPESESPEAKEFGHRMLGVVNDAAIALLLSIGHQTGLFDRMASLASATSTEIASAAGLDERYVREWLGGMVCAAIIDYDSTTHTYHLPAHHASALTRAGGPDNVAKMAQYIALLGEVEQRIVGCFRNGGGLPYDAFPRFHALRAEESREVVDAALITTILPLIALLVAMHAGLAFGCWPVLALGVPAGALTVRTFIIQHDCGHRSFCRARRANDYLGRFCSLLTLTP